MFQTNNRKCNAIMSSEIKVFDIEFEDVIKHDRSESEKMLLINMYEGLINEGGEIKNAIVVKCSFKKSLDENLLRLAQIFHTDNIILIENIDFETRQRILQ